ncbi:MAG: HlyD family secretion protein, partial [Bacteroidales bacterium]|nr:HlyD family secretion protein [Bacteroidales bacterium]
MSEERDYEIRSDEVNDILSKTPSWMVRTGSLMMVAVLSLIVVGSAFFSYPDIISAPVIITSAN